MKIIDPLTHTILDYILVVFFWLSPTIFNYGGSVALVIYLYGLLHFILTIATLSPLGLLKFIPLKTHGWIEFGLSILLIMVPWIFNFNEDLRIRNYFISTGVCLLLLWLFTNYRYIVKNP